MSISDRSKRLFREVHKLSAELAAIGHERDEAQIDAMLNYPVRADLSRLIRDWEGKLQQIERVQSNLKDELTNDGILSDRRKKKPASRKKRK